MLFLQRGVPLRQHLPVLLQYPEVAGHIQRQEDVQEPSPTTGSTRHQDHVRWREDDRGETTEPFADLLGLGSIHRHLLLPPRLKGRGDTDRALRIHRIVKRPGHPEQLLTEGHNLIVPGTSKGPEGLQIVNGLQEIRLPLSVASDNGDTVAGDVQLLNPQVSEVPELEHAQVHGVSAGRIPSSMTKVSTFPGSWLPHRDTWQTVARQALWKE